MLRSFYIGVCGQANVFYLNLHKMDCKLLSCQTPGVDIRAPLGFPGHEKTIASSSVGLHSEKSVSEGQMK